MSPCDHRWVVEVRRLPHDSQRLPPAYRAPLFPTWAQVFCATCGMTATEYEEEPANEATIPNHQEDIVHG